MDAIGFSLPTHVTQLQPRTIVVSLLVGTIVTVVAAVLPGPQGHQGAAGRGAARGRPRLDAAVAAARRHRHRRLRRSACVMFAWTVRQAPGCSSSGSACSADRLRRHHPRPACRAPDGRLIGWPLPLRGMPGELARQNAMRNPRRTASTAAALMIGLTLVVSVECLRIVAQGLGRRRARRLDQGRPVPRPGQHRRARASARRWPRTSPPCRASTPCPPPGSARPASPAPGTTLRVGRPGDRRPGARSGRLRRKLGRSRRPTGSMVRKAAADEHHWKVGSVGHRRVRLDRQARPARRRRSTTARRASSTATTS